ncbi:hypothetical protein J6590_020306 [Homalodisca vitripennis]|nr:hypothetical protein J6590_020306 [Homalodisca vitripennis]
MGAVSVTESEARSGSHGGGNYVISIPSNLEWTRLTRADLPPVLMDGGGLGVTSAGIIVD